MPSIPRALVVWFVTDDKPGHRSQLEGLQNALELKTPIVSVWLKPGIRNRSQLARSVAEPDLIVGAGHATHKTVLFLAKKYGAFSVVLMKPSLPLRWFGAVICPEHDAVRERKNVFKTQGVLNRVQATQRDSERDLSLIMLGGPSKHFDWSDQELLAQVRAICLHDRKSIWQVFNSRRTPDSFWEMIRSAGIENADLKDFRDQQEGLLAESLIRARHVWVSCDSVSMTYEALTAGARVGLLSIPPGKKDGRINRAVRQLVNEGKVTDFESWSQSHDYPPAGNLNEASRAADWLLDFYKIQVYK